MNKLTKYITIYTLFLLLLPYPILINCSVSSEDSPVIYGGWQFYDRFDPINMLGRHEHLLVNILEGLYGYDYKATESSLSVIPRLALNMGPWNDEGTEWTIPLRKDVVWHDGTPFTAEDVKWNWDRLTYFLNNDTAEFPQKYIWFNDEGELIVKETEVIDDYTFKFVLNKEWKDFVEMQGITGCFFIKPVVGKENEFIELEEIALINGTGPFILNGTNLNQEYYADFYDEVRLIANNEYYRGAPDIQKLTFKYFDNENEALINEESHVLMNAPLDIRDLIRNDSSFEFGIQKIPELYYMQLNINNIEWSLRKAMQYAFDYDGLAHMFENYTIGARSPIPDGILGHNKNLPELPLYDLTKARQYLIEDPVYRPMISSRISDIENDQEWIDCATNNPLKTLNFTNFFYQRTTPSFINDCMKYIGVNVIDHYIAGVYNYIGFIHANKSQLEASAHGWSGDYYHPINFIEHMYKTNGDSNYCGLANSTIDSWISEAHTVTGSELEVLTDKLVKAIMGDQAAAIYFYQMVNFPAWNTEIITGNTDGFTSVANVMYFYNVDTSLSDAPRDTIPSSYFVYILLAFTLASIGIIFGLRRLKKG